MVATINHLPLDVLRIIWKMCLYHPLREVCKQWAHHNTNKVDVWCFSTIPLMVWAISRNIGGKYIAKEDGLLTTIAASHGNIPLLEYLCSLGYPLDCDACEEAAKHGHLDTLKWLRQPISLVGQSLMVPRCEWDSYTPAAAIKGNHLHVFEWCKNNGCRISPGICMVGAAQAGHPDHLGMLEKLLESSKRKERKLLYGRLACTAATAGHVNVLRWVHSRINHVQGFAEWPSNVVSSAILCKKLNVVEYLLSAGGLFDETSREKCVTSWIVSGGDITVGEWLLMKGCFPHGKSDETISYTVQYGNASSLKWLLEVAYEGLRLSIDAVKEYVKQALLRDNVTTLDALIECGYGKYIYGLTFVSGYRFVGCIEKTKEWIDAHGITFRSSKLDDDDVVDEMAL